MDFLSVVEGGGSMLCDKSIKYLCADISELINDTGWKPEFSFEDGIKAIVYPKL